MQLYHSTGLMVLSLHGPVVWILCSSPLLQQHHPPRLFHIPRMHSNLMVLVQTVQSTRTVPFAVV